MAVATKGGPSMRLLIKVPSVLDTQMQRDGEYGYPSLYKNWPDEIIEPIKALAQRFRDVDGVLQAAEREELVPVGVHRPGGVGQALAGVRRGEPRGRGQPAEPELS